MKIRKAIKTTPQQIVDYWKEHLSDHSIGVEWEDATKYCWRCAYKRQLQRCHIIPDSLGGKDEASNMVSLCETCHSECPNVDDPEIIWDWIRAYCVPSYDIFWTIQGIKEYEYIYGTSLEKDVSDILALAGVKDDLKKYLKNAIPHSSMHFGQIYPNAATIAGTLRIMVKTIAKDYGVQFPVLIDELE